MRSPREHFRPFIPAGGVGSRLWPLSRADAPKFLLDLTGSGSSLLRSTYDRLVDLSAEGVMVVTGRTHAPAVRTQLPECSEEDLVLEPSPKDSGAAIGLASAILWLRDPEAIIGSFAADHVVEPTEEFHRAVVEAIETAATGRIVTIGITPTSPSTGFGYIRAGRSLDLEAAPSALAVEEFVEKPDQDTAREYVRSGRYTWNAGMFVAPAALLLEHLERNQPQLHAGIMEIARAWETEERDAVMDRVWPTLPKIAIDYAVAEPAAAAGDVAMVPAHFTWDDVGDFAAISRLNRAQNVDEVALLGSNTRVMTDDSSGIVVSDTSRIVALIGVQDIVVVDTPDALLVTTQEHAQRVKHAVDELKRNGDTDVL
ncbi:MULTISPECIES: mannose-1-phosphate guanylyltransferase [Rothia]|mgnify:FL=1|uniref:Mannose-1-phosphate guanylyltransferase n=1 Tax=Rothia kristinae TaxID=37923 RepID=A0A0Q2U897_9MICC|nr:mannose-1-phosphate guanylyltransferase [Rothia kristinae]MBE8526946.1 NTP transferase domain-containing protein [Amycolatopsis sp. H6(2020)]MDN5640240.1 NTP transferase domain-containing protein [Actinomycetes bacterium]TDP56061.1 mannose-1-phosphate guanylyltransferase [Kocuria sp. AG109]SIM86318.1 Mannose-1-phosphate guanylyltransferase rfbM [Mycobacteroides abscessus subsp. abscessus]KTR38164.1 mannose-1-phosphate guanylyltransferase [Rothia kristinae]